MKIVGWTDFGNSEYEHINIKTSEDHDEIRKVIAKELKLRGYKFTGDYHQNGDYGVPIFDNGTVYEGTQRAWGRIMCWAYPEEIDDSDGMGYCEWAWTSSKPMIVPNNLDYKITL